LRYNRETDKGEALSDSTNVGKEMQATLIESRAVETRFGTKQLGIFRTEEGIAGELWEAPEKNLVEVKVGSTIEVEKNNRGSGYRRVLLSETKVKNKVETKVVDKKEIADYSKEQIKLLAYLHKQVSETFAEKGIELSPELTEKYAVTTYLKVTKTLGY